MKKNIIERKIEDLESFYENIMIEQWDIRKEVNRLKAKLKKSIIMPLPVKIKKVEE